MFDLSSGTLRNCQLGFVMLNCGAKLRSAILKVSKCLKDSANLQSLPHGDTPKYRHGPVNVGCMA